MKERDCANCKHHTEDGCSSWDCEFEAKDLISRADAIEAVASITMSIHLSDVICDKLLALPSADAEWIPCSERLPKEGEKVLASTTNTVFTHIFKGTLGNSDSWWWNNNTIKTIYAWMPLPKPYKGGDDE